MLIDTYRYLSFNMPANEAVSHGKQARIQGVGAGARGHPWGGVSPFKMHYSIAFKRQFNTGHPPLGEIPSLVKSRFLT